ncbi:hypothetical protein ACFV2D_38240, partial [Streptomyces capillispiralis]|uniref:hypothetical protein n=1 Tax=Streptomyces capillispiralis TaxID=68182 RepID=UPI00369607EF
IQVDAPPGTPPGYTGGAPELERIQVDAPPGTPPGYTGGAPELERIQVDAPPGTPLRAGGERRPRRGSPCPRLSRPWLIDWLMPVKADCLTDALSDNLARRRRPSDTCVRRRRRPSDALSTTSTPVGRPHPDALLDPSWRLRLRLQRTGSGCTSGPIRIDPQAVMR